MGGGLEEERKSGERHEIDAHNSRRPFDNAIFLDCVRIVKKWKSKSRACHYYGGP